MHNMDAFQLLDAGKVTQEEKKGAIASLIFLTEKKWNIKGKAVHSWKKTMRVHVEGRFSISHHIK